MLKVNQLIGFGAESGNPYFISSSSGGISGSLETISWTHTTEPGTSCLVLTVMINTSTSTGTSTATFNGISLSEDASEIYSTNQGCRVFSLMNPPIGSFTLSTTMTATNNRAHAAFAMNLGNVRTVNGFTGNSGTSTSVSSTIATTKPSIICVAGYSKRSSSSTAGTLSVDPPSGTSQAETASIVANTLGVRCTAFYTTLQLPQTVTVELDSSVSALSGLVFAAAAYSQ